MDAEGKIVALEVDAKGETAGIGQNAVQPTIDAIIKAGTTKGVKPNSIKVEIDVDAVSGATFTINGIIDAVNDALSKID